VIAFAASVLLFLYFAIVGTALATGMHTRRDLIRSVLIAPILGALATILPIYWLSRAGLPVKTFALPLALALLAGAIAFLAWRRPLLPWRRLAPYGLIALGAFVATGWPLLGEGFAWVGSVNPDMTNYALTAARFVEHGFLQVPDPDAWARQTDWSLYFIAFQLAGNRPGPDLLLAWTAVILDRQTIAVYMPLLVALHVALIAAAAALVPTPQRYARLLTAGLLACSAMLTLGVTLQLIGQVLGLAILALGATLLLSPFGRYVGPARMRFVILAGIAMGGFLLTYPETIPFLGIAFLAYHGAAPRSERRFYGRGLAASVAIAAIACLIILPDALPLLTFLLDQTVSASVGRQHAQLFPYFLVPSGLGAIWGLLPFVVVGEGRWVRAAVVIGIALSLLAVVAVVQRCLRREPSALIAAVMMVLGVMMFLGISGFGMLKIAMYLQPFLLATMTVATCAWLRVSR